MSTIVSEERKVDAAAPPLSFVARLIRWYRGAVMDPATEKEEADWQQNSF